MGTLLNTNKIRNSIFKGDNDMNFMIQGEFLIYFSYALFFCLLSMLLMNRGFLTFGQRVPACPIGDPLFKEVPTVPALVHPAVSV